MESWWSALSTIEQVYWGFALPATLIFVILLAITIFSGGDDHTDVDDVDIDGGFQFITFKNLVGFFSVFGWAGLTALDFGAENNLSLLVAFLSGLLMMLLMAAIFYGLSRLTQTGTLKMENAINTMGEVYLNIPAKRGGIGKVQIKVQGAYRELEALTDDDEELTRGKIVTVTSVINEEILVVTAKTKES
jgi:hypothetical protein